MTKEATVGHNSGVAGDRLKSFVQRIEKLEDEKSIIGEDIKDVYAEAKSAGFNTKIIRKIISRRKKSEEVLREEEELLELYESAMGVFG